MALGCRGPEPEAEGGRDTASSSRALASIRVPQAVAAGAYHSLFLKKDGAVWAWGQNAAGQLGTGTTSSTPLPSPSRVNGLPAIKALAAGIAHSVALDVNGDVWVWGQNANGQSGLGSTGGTVLVPTKVPALSGIQAIAANGNYSIALREDGQLWAWGQNTSGQIGTRASSASVSSPTVIAGLPTIRAIAAGVNHVLALDAGGKVWAWGQNTFGQVGTGSVSTMVLTPTQVVGLPPVKAVAAGSGHSLIADEQFGNVWAWGQNTFGQAGTGNTSSPVLSPTPVNGVFAVATLVSGHNSSHVIMSGGLALAWGHNVSGQLGNGTTANSATPVNVVGLADAHSLAVGAQHALALRPGCPVWAWGHNAQGQMGTGSTSNPGPTAPVSTLLSNTFYFDGDMDGFGDEYLSEQACEPSPGFVEELDCDDYVATTYPGAPEVCNGVDDSCDGVVDDGDPSGGENCSTGQLGICATGTTACTAGSVACVQRHAASAETCDALDNDCDGVSDEGNPGGRQACSTGQQGVCGEGVTYCTHGAIECAPLRGPSTEACDGLDNDCNGQSDDGLAFQSWYRDQDGDNYGVTSQSVLACAQPSGHAPNPGDCDDRQEGINPGATEVCDGVDNNCSGAVDEGLPTHVWYRDADGDGYGVTGESVQNCQQPSGYVSNPSDCNDANTAIRPGVEEVCDGVDNNCSGVVDEGVKTTFYRDGDSDGYGNAGQSTLACSQPSGYVANTTDCNDANSGIHPGIAEVCDGLDNNCDTLVDAVQEGFVCAASASPLVAAGSTHSAVVRPDGTVWTSGRTTSGQLGDGTIVQRLMPVQVIGIASVKALAASENHSVALRHDGTLWSWGYNSDGQLGDGTSIERSTPVQVMGLSDVTAIAAGYGCTIALQRDGTVWGWGTNFYGQLGDGLTFGSKTPVQILAGVTAIVSGDRHTVALRQDGTVWTWGYNMDGQLGDGATSIYRRTPMQVMGLAGVTAIAAGGGHTVALRQDGTVWAWGDNIYGQLGDGTNNDRLMPVQVTGISGATAIAAGHEHTVMLRQDGSLWAWGFNSDGQLGDGTTTRRSTPVQVLGLTGVTAIAGDGDHTMALRQDGTLWTWGYNQSGQLGDGTTTRRTAPGYVLSGVAAIAAGDSHTMAVRQSGDVWAWGNNNHGQLGDGILLWRSSRVQVAGLFGVMAISSRSNHTVALRQDGTLWAWGINSSGQLGDGTTSQRSTPVQVTGLSGVTAIAAGGSHSVALRQNGTVWAWGSNSYGQLGDGTTTRRTTPVQVVGLVGVTAIAAGGGYSLALKQDGTVWAWGENFDGQLGDGTRVQRSTPMQVTGLSGVTVIAAGSDHALALRQDGTLWAWGFNSSGQLGDGTIDDRSTPVQMTGLSGVAAIVAGGNHSAALRQNGTLWAWGSNSSGQLGDGTAGRRAAPVQVLGVYGVTAVAAGGSHMVALRPDGVLSAWGRNTDGQLGDGTTIDRYRPVHVPGP